MAEGGDDILEVEMSFPTAEAVRSAKEFAAAAQSVEEKLDKIDDSSDAAAAALKKVGDANKDTAKSADTATTAIDKETVATNTGRDAKGRFIEGAKKAKRANEELGESHAKVGNETDMAAAKVKQLIGSYLGMATVQKILETIRDRVVAIKNATADLVGERMTLDQSLRSLVFNLGLSPDEAGMKKARDLQSQLSKAAPGASFEQISGAVGAGASFGLTPEKAQDAQVIAIVSRTAALMELNKQSTGDLVKFLAAVNATTPAAAQKVLSQFLEAARTTPVENQAEFAEGFIRATLPLVQRGMKLEQAAGLFSGAAVGEPSARIAATRVQQATAVFSGKDDNAAAALFDRARSAGLLSQETVQALSNAQREIMGSMTPEQKGRFEETQRSLAQIEASEKREQAQFKRDIEAAERDLQAAKGKSKDTLDIQNRITNRREQNEAETQSLANRRAATQGSISEQSRTSESAAKAKIYTALPIEDRRKIFMSLAQGAKNPRELEALLTSAGATPEETANISSIISPRGQTQAAATVAAVAGAKSSSVTDAASAFESTELSRAAATETQSILGGAETVTSGDQFAESFMKSAEREANVRLRKEGDKILGTFTVRLPFSNSWFTVGWFLTSFFRALSAADLLLQQIKNWWDGLTPEERTWLFSVKAGTPYWRDQEEYIKTIAEKNIDIFATLDSAVRKVARDFGAIQRWILDRRSKQKTDATGKGAGVSGARGGGGSAGSPSDAVGGNAGASAAGISDLGVSGGVGGGGESGGAMGSMAYSGSSQTIYNISVGTLVSQGGNVLDLPGALEAEA